MPPVATLIPRLEGARVHLRPFARTDAERISALLATPDVSATTLNLPYPYPDDAATAWIATHAQRARGGSLTWAIVRSHDNRLMGAITLGITASHRRGNLGYWIGVPFWNHGYMSEVVRLVTAYGLDDRHLVRVQAGCFPRNGASRRVLEKAGFMLEGILRGYVLKDGTPEDVAMYARLGPARMRE